MPEIDGESVLRALFRGTFGSDPNESSVEVKRLVEHAERQLQVLMDVRDLLRTILDEIRDMRGVMTGDE